MADGAVLGIDLLALGIAALAGAEPGAVGRNGKEAGELLRRRRRAEVETLRIARLGSGGTGDARGERAYGGEERRSKHGHC
jgi:hypothetical protein